MPFSPSFLDLGREWYPPTGNWSYTPPYPHPVALPYRLRNRHLYMLGTTGVGKSTLMRTMITGDIARGHGVTLITPNNDHNLLIMQHIPPEYHDRVIYVDPEHTQRPVAYNPLTLHPGENMTTKVAQLLAIFRNAMSEFTQQQDALLTHALYALLNRPRSTLTDLLDLIDPDTADRREAILASTSHAEACRYFRAAYPAVARVSTLPILNRFRDVRLTEPFQLTLCQPEGTLNLNDVLNTGKILLLNLSPALGEGNATILGQFMLAAFQQALELRYRFLDQHEALTPHYLYIDELQLFAKHNSTVLTRLFELGRNLNLGITVINHGLWQLPTDVERDVLALANIKIVFRLDARDAATLANYLHTDADTLKQLPDYHAAVRIEPTTTFIATAPDQRSHPDFQDAITKASRERYGRPPTLATTDQPAYNEGEQPKPKSKPPEHWLE